MAAVQSNSSDHLNNLRINWEEIDFTNSQVIGQGGFGIVRTAIWKTQMVAIKVFLLAPNQSEERRLESELQIMSKVSQVGCHNIVHLHGFCKKVEDGDIKYGIVMEYCPKRSLLTFLETHKPLPWSLSLKLALDIVKGLTVLHQHDIVHRDLKGDNILLEKIPAQGDKKKSLRAKICDFGVSKILDGNKGSHTKEVGTLKYWPPELYNNEEISNPKASDIFSLGTIFWEIIARRKAFDDISPGYYLLMLQQQNGAELHQKYISEAWNQEYSALIMRCWSFDPKERPALAEIERTLTLLISNSKTHSKSKSLVLSSGPRVRFNSLNETTQYGAFSPLPNNNHPLEVRSSSSLQPAHASRVVGILPPGHSQQLGGEFESQEITRAKFVAPDNVQKTDSRSSLRTGEVFVNRVEKVIIEASSTTSSDLDQFVLKIFLKNSKASPNPPLKHLIRRTGLSSGADLIQQMVFPYFKMLTQIELTGYWSKNITLLGVVLRAFESLKSFTFPPYEVKDSVEFHGILSHVKGVESLNLYQVGHIKPENLSFIHANFRQLKVIWLRASQKIVEQSALRQYQLGLEVTSETMRTLSLNNLPNITSLSFRNPIGDGEELEVLKGLTNLQALKMQLAHDLTIPMLSNLRSLDIADSSFLEDQAQILHMTALRSLNILGCTQLTDGFIHRIVNHLTNLTTLYCSKGLIQEVPNQTLKILTKREQADEQITYGFAKV